MNYHHLTIEERSCIRRYYVDGLSYREIARLIGRNVSTVSREIRRNCTHMYDIPTYYPHTAQKKYLLRRSYCHRGMFHSQEVIEYINEKLKATWSPEQIACTPCEPNLPTGAELRNGCTARSILPTPIVPGRKALTRISTACSGSFIRKAEIYPVSLPPR